MSPISEMKRRIVVLLVDDQPIIGETVHQMLREEADIEFHFCSEPAQAIPTANRIAPTVILQDLVMPELDGMTLVRYFRANQVTRDVPLIVLSSKEEGGVKAEAFALGVDDYMVKFPDRLEVIARIRYHSGAYLNLLERNQAMRALEQAKHAAEEANRSKSTFLANMSHEIRTPMNAILGFAEVLAKVARDPVEREYLEAIQTSGKALLDLIDDILDLSKVEAGKLTLQYVPVDPRTLCEDMNIIFMQKLQAKGLEFAFEIPPAFPDALMLDETRLRQVLLNLVGNAVKFTERGRITLKAWHEWLEADDIRLYFEVVDTGIGIPADQLESIFGAFEQQREQSHAKYGGTGLGLAICKRLTELMGGEIQLVSNPGEGSTFRVVLHHVEPSMTATVRAAHADDPARIRFAPATVLIADDEALSRKLLCAHLQDYGFTLLQAEDGEQAVELARRNRPDAILMDIKMPHLGGDQAAHMLKQDPATHGIPIIAVTALAMKDSETQLHALCDGYLAKPVSRTDLVHALLPFLAHQVDNTSAISKDAVTPSNRAGMPTALAKYLHTVAAPRIKRLRDHASINEIETFAGQILDLAREYDCPRLRDWAEHLNAQAGMFNMEGINRSFDEFAELLGENH